MKKSSISMLILILVLGTGVNDIPAQISLRNPKLKMIKNPTVEQLKTEETKTDMESGTYQSFYPKSSMEETEVDDEMDFRLSMFLDDIAKAQGEVDEYTPETKTYLLQGKYYDWLVRAVSMRAK